MIEDDFSRNINSKSMKNSKEPLNQVSSEEEYLVIASMTNFFHLLDTINNKEKEIEEKAKIKEKKEKQETLKNESKNQPNREKSINRPHSSLIEMKQYDLFPLDKLDIKLTNPSDRIPIIEADIKATPLNKTHQNQEIIRNNTLKNPTQQKAIKPLRYFILLRVFIFFFLTLNGCYYWILHYMISMPKNRYYCFNVYAKEFKPCSLTDFCPNEGHIDIIYNNFDNHEPSYLEPINEAKKINEEYSLFYIKDTALFSILNKKYLKTDSIASYYSVVIIMTNRENYIYMNTFKNICLTGSIDFFITFIIATVIGNALFGFLADVIGRKKLLILLVMIEVIGGMIVFGETMFIIEKGVSDGNKSYGNNKKMFDFDHKEYLNINEFIQSSNRLEFGKSNLNEKYQENFNKIKGEVLQGLFIKMNYTQYKLFFLLGIFLISICNSSIFTISIAYFMENAVTEDFFYNNNIILHWTKPFSIFITFLFVTQIDSFHIPLLIINCCMIVMVILFIIFFYESQRFNIEYCYYADITKFAEFIFGKETLKNEYLEKDIENESKKDQEPFVNTKSNKDNKQQKDDEKKQTAVTLLYHKSSPTIETEYMFYLENKHCSIWDSIAMKYTYDNEVILSKKSMKKQMKKENALRRDKIISSPFKHLIDFMKSDKQIKNHNLITIAFISIVGIVSHLCYWKITSILFYSRANLINNDLFSTHILLFCVISLFVILGYNWIMKFLGPNTILIASFIMITLFSIIFEIIGLSDRERTDLNKNLYGSYEIIAESYRKGLLCCLYFCLIGSIGLIIGMYFFITKLTKTIYRCSYYGYCQIFVDIAYVLSIGLEKNTEKTFFYVGLFSIIGLINTFFISTNADAVIIKDYRTITYDEKKEKKNN